MGEVTVMVTLSEDTFAALQSRAQTEGTAPGAILRAALRRDLVKPDQPANNAGPDPALVGALRTLLARDIIEARDWSDLQRRFGSRGYRLSLENGCLTLISKDTGQCISDATGIGASYGALMRRFGGPLLAPNKGMGDASAR